MRILISGSSGLIGRALAAHLKHSGHEIIPLRRAGDTHVHGLPVWEPIRNQTWEQKVGTVDAVVHLAGENIAARRWTREVKQRLRDSRIPGTEQLCRHLSSLAQKPRVLVAASAVGFYGDRGDEILTEASAPGTGFLAELCEAWEKACLTASLAGIRVVNLRIGTVLAKEGGALAKMLPLYRFGLGGKLGSGSQWISWIALEDLILVIERVLMLNEFQGPVNAVSPNPVRNRDFSQALGDVLRRPTLFPVPGAVLRVALGEMADSLLLTSARVEPRRLQDVGFPFRFPDLETVLKHILREY